MFFISLAVVFSLSMATLTTVFLLNKAESENNEKNTKRIDQLISNTINNEITKLKSQAELIGELPILAATVNTGDVTTIRDTANVYKDQVLVDIMNIFSPNGEIMTALGAKFDDVSENEFNLLIGSATEGEIQALVALYNGKFAVLTLAPIGIKQNPSGYLMLGQFLDDQFAKEINEFTNVNISFYRKDNSLISSSLTENESKFQSEIIKEKSTDIHFYETEKSVLHNLAVKGAEDSLGFITLQFSREELNKTKNKIYRITFFVTLALVVAGILLSLLISQSLSKPIVNLKDTIKSIIDSGDLSKKADIKGVSEIETLSKYFNGLLQEVKSQQDKLEEYNRTLEIKVAERTAELAEAKDTIQNLLDNLDDGYMCIDKEGLVIKDSSSKKADDIFETSVEDKKLVDLLATPDQKQAVETWLNVLFSGNLPFDAAKGLGPKVLEKRTDAYIELDYRAITDSEGNIKYIICISADKTVEKELREKIELEQAKMKSIVSILKSKKDFAIQIKNTRTGLSRIFEHTQDNKLIDFLSIALRELHTIKGTIAGFNLPQFVHLAHELETKISPLKEKAELLNENLRKEILEDINHFNTELTNYLKENKFALGNLEEDTDETTYKEVDANSISKFEEELKIKIGEENEIYKHFCNEFVLDPLDSQFKKFQEAVDLVSEKQNKSVALKIQSSQIKVRLEKYNEFINSLVHVFRNAVDHGIEASAIRQIMQKPEHGTIEVNLALNDDKILVEIEDDGKGVDPIAVAASAIEKGLLTETEANNLSDKEKMMLIFKEGFSTNDEITDISGRGVGLDAVDYEVKQLGGKLDIESTKGRGTKFKIELPHLV